MSMAESPRTRPPTYCSTADVDEAYLLVPMGGHGRERPRSALERVDRLVRRAIMRTIDRDAKALRARGVRVHVLTPGSADLSAMGVNLMDPRSRGEVLDSARSTVATLLRRELRAREPLDVPARRASGGRA